MRRAALPLLLALFSAVAWLVLPGRAQAGPVSVRILERDHSGVSGKATLDAADGAVWVKIQVRGAKRDYLPYLHRGTCDAYRETPAIPLSLVAPGHTSETAIDLPLEELDSGDYVIDLHAADGDIASLLDPATSVACGVIGAKTAATPTGEAAGSTHPPSTGVGPLESGHGRLLTLMGALCLSSLILACLGAGVRQRPQHVPVVIDVVARHRLRGLMR
jgi:hypothetical protein